MACTVPSKAALYSRFVSEYIEAGVRYDDVIFRKWRSKNGGSCDCVWRREQVGGEYMRAADDTGNCHKQINDVHERLKT